jgi:4-amino-4-deoxy-L-arabinose transferase-like glycosyltransferase
MTLDADGGTRRTLALVILAALALAPPIVGRELLPPDEPRFALVAREMARSGDLVVLTRGDELYTDKPPLLFWAQAACLELLGHDVEAATRIPSLLATLFLVGLLHRSARRWFGEPLATRSALVFLSLSLVLQRGAWAATDALLAATVFATVALSERARDGGRLSEVGAGAFLGLALLAKGPVALVFLVLAGVASLAGGTRAFSLRPLLRPSALAAFALVALPWPLLWVSRLGVTHVTSVLWRQNVERFLDSWDNIEPWWYQAEALVLGALPWSLLLWTALFPQVYRGWTTRPRLRWLLVWVALALVFFSLPEGKRGVYLLPVYPALAILAAAAVSRLVERRRLRRAAALLPGALALVVLGAVLTGNVPLPSEIAGEPAVVEGASALLLLLALCLGTTAWWCWRGSERVFVGPVMLAVGAGLLAPSHLTPAINAGQGGEPFASALRDVVPEEAELARTRTKWEIMAWYTDRQAPWLRSPEEVRRFLEEPGRRVVVGSRDELGAPESWPAGTERRARLRLGRRQIDVLVREPRGPSGAAEDEGTK